MRSVTPFLLCFPLLACAAQSASYATTVSDVQIAYHVTEALVNAAIADNRIPATDAATIKKIEAIDDPLIVSLSATTAPTSLAALLQDAQTLTAQLPAGTVATDAQIAISIAQAAANAQIAAATD
jgi:hypothetical protein